MGPPPGYFGPPSYAPPPGYVPPQAYGGPSGYGPPQGYGGAPGYAPAYYAPPPKQKGRPRGCLITLLIFAVIVVIPLALILRVPQMIGLTKAPADAVFSNPVDRGTGALAVEELAATGYPTSGLRIYVYDNPAGGTIGYAILDGEHDFNFGSNVSGDPVLDFMGRMANLETLTDSGMSVIAFAYRNGEGKVVTVMTTSVRAAQAYAAGVLPEEGFIDQINGWVDPIFLLSPGGGEGGF